MQPAHNRAFLYPTEKLNLSLPTSQVVEASTSSILEPARQAVPYILRILEHIQTKTWSRNFFVTL